MHIVDKGIESNLLFFFVLAMEHFVGILPIEYSKYRKHGQFMYDSNLQGKHTRLQIRRAVDNRKWIMPPKPKRKWG